MVCFKYRLTIKQAPKPRLQFLTLELEGTVYWNQLKLPFGVSSIKYIAFRLSRDCNTVMQRQTVVTAHLETKQLLLFVFSLQRDCFSSLRGTGSPPMWRKEYRLDKLALISSCMLGSVDAPLCEEASHRDQGAIQRSGRVRKINKLTAAIWNLIESTPQSAAHSWKFALTTDDLRTAETVRGSWIQIRRESVVHSRYSSQFARTKSVPDQNGCPHHPSFGWGVRAVMSWPPHRARGKLPMSI